MCIYVYLYIIHIYILHELWSILYIYYIYSMVYNSILHIYNSYISIYKFGVFDDVIYIC